MTNEELQKLKDLAIAAGGDDWDFDTAETPIRIAGGEVVGGDALPYGDVYTMRDYEQLDEDGEPVSEPLTICSEIGAQFGRFIARASPAVVLELIALAERATQPADGKASNSADSSDTFGDKWHSLTCDGTCSPPCKDAPLPPSVEVGGLSDDQLDYIARAYFADEHGQTKAKGAIHDALKMLRATTILAASTPTTLTEKKE